MQTRLCCVWAHSLSGSKTELSSTARRRLCISHLADPLSQRSERGLGAEFAVDARQSGRSGPLVSCAGNEQRVLKNLQNLTQSARQVFLPSTSLPFSGCRMDLAISWETKPGVRKHRQLSRDLQLAYLAAGRTNTDGCARNRQECSEEANHSDATNVRHGRHCESQRTTIGVGSLLLCNHLGHL